jgi:hypothetical protein
MEAAARREVAVATIFALASVVKAVLQLIILPVIICRHAQGAEMLFIKNRAEDLENMSKTKDKTARINGLKVQCNVVT